MTELTSPSIPELPEIFDAQTAEDHFHLSRSMVYQLLSNPNCGVIRIGRRKFFHRDSFLKWLEDQKISQGA